MDTPQLSKINDTTVTSAEAIGGSRVDERAQSLFYPLFWHAYKGHYRGGLTGAIVGGVLGAATGLALTFAFPALAFIAVPALAGMGALLASEEFTAVGSATASRAIGLAEKHAALNDPVYQGNELAALNDKLMIDGRSHHYEFPPERDDNRPFFPVSGMMGALICGTLGALVAAAGEMTGVLATAGLAATGTLPVIAAGALVAGLFGLTFGINRSVFKSILNQTDANIQGEIHTGRDGPDLGQAQFAGIENDKELLQHRLRRQDDITHLEHDYSKRIFQGTINGYLRGFVGGIAAGVLIGAGIGALVFGGAALLGVAGVTFAGMVAGFASLGALFGMKTFADPGAQAGAESTARAIDEEFQRNRLLKAQGLPVPPQQKSPGQGFNLTAAILMGGLGAATGVLLFPVLGAGILGITGLTGVEVAVAALATGAAGATIGGMGNALWESVSTFASNIYDISSPIKPSVPQQAIPTPSREAIPQISQEDMAILNSKLDTANRVGDHIAQFSTPAGGYAGKPSAAMRTFAEREFARMQSQPDMSRQ